MMTTPPPPVPSPLPPFLAAWVRLAVVGLVGCGGASRGDDGTTPGGAAPFDPAAETVVHLAGMGGGRALPTGRFLSAGVLGRVDETGERVVWATEPPALAEFVDGTAFHADGGATVVASGAVFHSPGHGTGFTAIGRVPDGFGWVGGAPRAHAGPFLLARKADGRRFVLDPAAAELTPLPATERGFVQLAMLDRGQGIGLGLDARLWRWSIGDGAPTPLPDDLPVGMPLSAGNGEVWLMPARGTASPLRLDPSTGETLPATPPPALGSGGRRAPRPQAPGLPTVATTEDGSLLSLSDDGVLRRHDPRTLAVRGEARPAGLAGARCFLVPRGSAVLARCVVSDTPDGRARARFFRVAPSGEGVTPVSIPGMAGGTTIDALVSEGGSAIFWEGTCGTPVGWGDSDAAEDLVYDEHGQPVDAAGDGGDPWCVVTLEPVAAAQVRLPRRLGRPVGLVGGRFVGRARAGGGGGGLEPMDPDGDADRGAPRDLLWAFDVTSGAVVEAPAPWSPDASPVEIEVQPDGTVLTLAMTFAPPTDGAEEPTMLVRAHRADLDDLFDDPDAPWTTLSLPEGLLGVGFGPAGRHGLAVAADGLRATHDGAATWTELPLPLEGDASRLLTRTTRVRCGALACGRAETGAGLPFLVVGHGAAVVRGQGVVAAPPADELAALAVQADDAAPTLETSPAGFRCEVDPDAIRTAGEAPFDPDSGATLPAPLHSLPRLRRTETVRQVHNALDLTVAVVADPGSRDDDGTVRTRVLWGGRDARRRPFRRASAIFLANRFDDPVRVLSASPAGVVVSRAGGRPGRDASGAVQWIASGEAPVPIQEPGGAELIGTTFGLPGVLPGARLVIGRAVSTDMGFAYDELLVVGPGGRVQPNATPQWDADRSAIALAAPTSGAAEVLRWQGLRALALPLGSSERVWPDARPALDGRSTALAACAGNHADAPRVTVSLSDIEDLGLLAPFRGGVAELAAPDAAPPCIRRVLVTSWRGLADGEPSPAILVATDGALVADGVRCTPPG